MTSEPTDPRFTVPPTEPADPDVASLLTPKQRLWMYAILRVLNGVWIPIAAVIVTQTDNVWAAAVPSAVLSGLNAAGFTVSKANVPVTK